VFVLLIYIIFHPHAIYGTEVWMHVAHNGEHNGNHGKRNRPRLAATRWTFGTRNVCACVFARCSSTSKTRMWQETRFQISGAHEPVITARLHFEKRCCSHEFLIPEIVFREQNLDNPVDETRLPAISWKIEAVVSGHFSTL